MTLRHFAYIFYIIGIIQKGCITKSINEHNNFSRHFKPLSELNLIDNFLFSTLMETPEYAEAITKLIIKRATGRNLDNIEIEYQKQLMEKIL